MKKTFNFGKIDYLGSGRRNCAVTVEVELESGKDDKPIFSVSGTIWNTKKTDTYSFGQNLDEIAKHIDDPLFAKIYTYWKMYHLNHMNAGCRHQRALGWGMTMLKMPCPVCGYKWGTEWKYSPIDPEDLEDIKAMLSE